MILHHIYIFLNHVCQYCSLSLPLPCPPPPLQTQWCKQKNTMEGHTPWYIMLRELWPQFNGPDPRYPAQFHHHISHTQYPTSCIPHPTLAQLIWPSGPGPMALLLHLASCPSTGFGLVSILLTRLLSFEWICLIPVWSFWFWRWRENTFIGGRIYHAL